MWVRTVYAVRDSPLLGSGGLHTSPTTSHLSHHTFPDSMNRIAFLLMSQWFSNMKALGQLPWNPFNFPSTRNAIALQFCKGWDKLTAPVSFSMPSSLQKFKSSFPEATGEFLLPSQCQCVGHMAENSLSFLRGSVRHRNRQRFCVSALRALLMEHQKLLCLEMTHTHFLLFWRLKFKFTASAHLIWTERACLLAHRWSSCCVLIWWGQQQKKQICFGGC